MAVIVYPNTFAPNTLASAAEVNANFNAITAQVNGNLEAANLATDAVTTVKIADANVTTAKIADANVTDAKIAPGIDAAKIGAGTVSNTEYAYLNGVTSAIQTQLAARALTSTTISAGTGLTGGGSLGANRTISHAAHTGDVTGDAALTIAAGAVTPSKTSFLDSNAASAALYTGRVSSVGAAERLPTGWTCGEGSGIYTVYHNLGTTDYNVVATATAAGSSNTLAVNITSRASNSFTYHIRDEAAGLRLATVGFILFQY